MSTIKQPDLLKNIEWKSILGRNTLRFILPGAGILVFLFILFLVFFPVSQRIKVLKKSVETNEAGLKELVYLSKRYKELKEFNSAIDRKITKKGAKFELLSFLEEVAKKAGIGEKISSMSPKETESNEFSVSVVIRDLDTEELTDFLYQVINSDKALAVRKMHLKVLERGPKSLEASLIISTPKLSHESPS
ncbi:MAG: hypothetical protein ACMUHX_06805 [bacterium]